jgi:hypothetical protein
MRKEISHRNGVDARDQMERGVGRGAVPLVAGRKDRLAE